MRKGERKKQDIIDTAAAMFEKQGYPGTSVQDIIDHLNCSKGSFYHHFKTKLDVLLAITQQRAQEAGARYRADSPMNPGAALNTLLLEASCLNIPNLPLIKNLIELQDEFEGQALLSVLHKAIMAQFFTPFSRVVAGLKQNEQAVYADFQTLQMVLAGFLAGCALLVEQLALPQTDKDPGKLIGLLRALRRQVEAGLGLAPGLVVIMEHEDLLALAGILL
jgi:AcrR family transcriptional regulator